MGNKKFRDPIYGYIEVDEKLIEHVIDTSTFQRLRDIIQTSYAPLYSSAVHNRFVHSIGVYHLGRMVTQTITPSFSDDSLSNVEKYNITFELACLLHDVGHAPFSHTGEMLYLKEGDRSILHRELVELTGDHNLETEIVRNAYKAAPHELMSAIVSLKTFCAQIPMEMRSFFARCICGYKYVDEVDREKSYMNCLIELLNSKIIDVDKLDYLLRDAYMTGFDTVSIDYSRLLDSIRFRENPQGLYQVCYYKSAVSVIENVVYAHDAERKWIQNHPIVLYDAHLIEEMMTLIVHDIFNEDYLKENYLTDEGVQISGIGRVRLLSDADIRYLMKNLPESALCNEYYDRRLRKHPIWKTEAEFQAIFEGRENDLSIIKEEFDSLKDYLRSQGLPFLINENALASCKAEVEQLQADLVHAQGVARDKIKSAIVVREAHIRWIEIFDRFASEQHIDFEFLIIYTDQFNSGFRKQEFENIEILFPELKQPCRFGAVSNVLKSEKSKGEKFFFLYYTRETAMQRVNITSLIGEMLRLASEMSLQKTFNDRFV